MMGSPAHQEKAMSIIIVHDPLTAKLAAADAPLEVCAPDGRLLGYFTPAKERQYNLEPPGTPEELDARFAAGGGRPLADILRDLEKRS
jgi:hypothetical protein